MKKIINFNYIWQAFQLSIGKIIMYLAIFSGGSTILNAMPVFFVSEETKDICNIIIFGLFFVVAIFQFCSAWHFIICGGAPKFINGNAIQFKKGSFKDNMESIIDENFSIGQKKRKKKEPEQWNFISGMDRTALLSNSTTTGVLFDVMKEFLPSLEMKKEVQNSIEKELENMNIQRDATGYIPYGTCITVPLNLERKGERVSFYLTLIANSEHVDRGVSKDQDLARYNMIKMDYPTDELIKKLFQHLSTLPIYSHMVGAIGTKGLGFSYQEMMTLMVSNYYMLFRNENRKSKLIISVRDSDYEEHGLNIADLQQYITSAARFYNKSKKDQD